MPVISAFFKVEDSCSRLCACARIRFLRYCIDIRVWPISQLEQISSGHTEIICRDTHSFHAESNTKMGSGKHQNYLIWDFTTSEESRLGDGYEQQASIYGCRRIQERSRTGIWTTGKRVG